VIAVAKKRTTFEKYRIADAVERSTRASAKLENRIVPEDFVRSAAVDQFLKERQKKFS